jgi:hypothetical protein
MSTIKTRDVDLAADLLEQVEELIEDFIRDNLDQGLEMDDLVEQYETCRQHIRENLFKENRV